MAKYLIQVRDSGLNLLGQLDDYLSADIIPRYNDVGAYELVVRADIAQAANLQVGNGLIFKRDYGNGSYATIMSGPIRALEQKGDLANTLTVTGPDDLVVLRDRGAYPLGGLPYMADVLSDAPARYLRLGEASGTVANDSSGNAQNGTYTGGVTLAQTGPIANDPNTAALFNGTSGYVSVPTTGLPTGNASWSWVGWFKIAANPSSTRVIGQYGAAASHQASSIYVTSTGGVAAGTFGTGNDTAASSAVSLNAWHFAVGTWDGTTLRCYVDGAPTATATPGAMTMPTSGLAMQIGAGFSGTQFFPGQIAEAAYYPNVVLSATRITALYNKGLASKSAYDTRTKITASTILQQYVTANAISPQDSSRAVSNLVLGSDPGVGTAISGNLRYDNLLLALQSLALAGGDIGFRVVQVGTQLQFQCYQPQTVAGATFSQALVNLQDYTYSQQAPTCNYVVVLGAGTGLGRTATVVQDAPSIAQWGRIEQVIDARDTADIATLQQRGTDAVNQGRQQTNLAITPIDTPALMYGRDYNLGDRVSVQVNGATITDVIREVNLKLTPQDADVITPALGTPGNVTAQPQVKALFDAFYRTVRKLDQRTSALETRV